ncbi:MAG: Cyanophycin synthetase [Candidatus Parcubacteria bacterium]|jgi:D-alanine-D-alanine ligase-like ATP-grasp enzyme
MVKVTRTPDIFRQAAKTCGYTCSQLDAPYSKAFSISDGKRQFITDHKHSYGIYPNSQFASCLANDKATTKRVLKKFGFRIIKGKQFYIINLSRTPLLEKDRATAAVAYAKSIGYPVFVKPNKGSLGTNARIIFTKQALNAHIKKMRHDGVESFLVEKLTERPEYRIFVVNGVPQFMYRKQRVSVTGTGSHTIAELIAMMKNDVNDEVLKKMLKKEGKTEHSVLEAERELILQETANISTGAEIVDYRDTFPTSIKTWTKELYKVTGLSVYGVDVFTKGAWNEPGDYLIIEVNSNASLLGIWKKGYKDKALQICTLIMKDFFEKK